MPEALTLPPSVLDLILSRANVSLGAVLEALDDIPTEPDLGCIAP